MTIQNPSSASHSFLSVGLKGLSALLASATIAASAQADVRLPGDEPKVLDCADTTQDIRFVARETALPLYLTASVTFSNDVTSDGVNMGCHLNQIPMPSTGPVLADGETVLMECTETRGGDGRYLATVVSGGLIGRTRVILQQEQIFPLPPANVAMLFCKM